MNICAILITCSHFHLAEVKALELLKSDSSNKSNAREPNYYFDIPTQHTVQPNKDMKPNGGAPEQVIEISDSDSEDSGSSRLPGEDEMVWYYMDPQEQQQGPFSMSMLRAWQHKGFFDNRFKVWRKGQSIQDGVLLCDITLRGKGCGARR
jgi:GYF domain